jgi:hypothetical protein
MIKTVTQVGGYDGLISWDCTCYDNICVKGYNYTPR